MNDSGLCPRCRRAVTLLRTRRGVVLADHDFSDNRARRTRCPGTGRAPHA